MHLRLPIAACVVLLLAACQAPPSLQNPDSYTPAPGDPGLRSKIVGVWLFDQLGSPTTHVASRTAYCADGTFVADYRISHPGASTCFRETGHWQVTGGMFIEEATKTTNPNGKTCPKFFRHVISASPEVLLIESRTGMRARLLRGPGKPSNPPPPLDEGRLVADLATRKMRGFVPVPLKGHGDQVAWKVESPVIEALKNR